MLAFTLRRAIQAIGVMIAVGIISFSMFRFRRRPRQPDGLHRHLGGRARRDPPVPRPRRSRAGPVRALFRQRRPVQIRHLLPVSPAGRESPEGADAGDAGARHLRHDLRDGVRHPDGGLFGAAARHLAGKDVAGGFADRDLAADLPDRHPADLPVRGGAGLAAVVRPRRGGADRLVDHRAAHGLRPQGPDPALDHARPVPDDPDHAAGAGRDARGAAHRLLSASRGRAD